MFKLYNEEDITFPDGSVFSKSDLLENQFYKAIANQPCILDVDDFGIVRSFITVKSAKNVADISDDDSSIVLKKYNEYIDSLKDKDIKEQITFEALQTTDSIHDQAIGELGVSTAALLESNTQLTSANADVLQAIGELGAMVAAMQVSSDTHSNVSGETA